MEERTLHLETNEYGVVCFAQGPLRQVLHEPIEDAREFIEANFDARVVRDNPGG